MNRLRASGGVLADSSPPATGLGAGSRTTAIRYFRPFANSKTPKIQPKTRFVNLMSHYITKPIPTEKPLIDLVKRPWGSFKQYAHNRDCTVSLMTVLPGQRLSLQSHTGRAELWIVLDDGAVVQVGDAAREYRAGDEIWIPANEKHRLACNDGPRSIRVLEVAFGNWQQADITRYDDDFKRAAQGE